MKPPGAPVDGRTAAPGIPPPAASLRLVTLTQRADFLRAARALHLSRPGFVLQLRKRRPDEAAPAEAIRVGFTCSKKVGNAVARNRAKRRLREIARLALPTLGRPGFDYVLIGRRDATATLPFAQLQSDFAKAVSNLHDRAT